MKRFAAILLMALLFCVVGCAIQPQSSGVLSSAEEISGVNAGQSKPGTYTTIRVTGKGVAPDGVTNPAQAKILAERAAEADAYRLLAEKLRGVLVTTLQTAQDGKITNDIIHTQTEALLRATQIVDIRHYPDGLTEVDMILRLSKNDYGNN